MPLKIYVKERYSVQKKVINYISYITLTVGMCLLFWAFYPIISFEIYSNLFIKRKINSPILSQGQVASEYSSSILDQMQFYSNNLRDFTQADLWFPTKPQKPNSNTGSIKEYYLSIPRLNIEKATVFVGGNDLSKSLIHYLPESMPGENGNVVIFGHSTLPQFYNTKDYKTIFTYLPSLDKSDVVQVKVGDTTYEYEVVDMFVVKPEQVSVLEQKKDAAYITLITCVPPGTYWNRLVVRAKLIQIPTSF